MLTVYDMALTCKTCQVEYIYIYFIFFLSLFSQFVILFVVVGGAAELVAASPRGRPQGAAEPTAASAS
jgi:hypothetical protein